MKKYIGIRIVEAKPMSLGDYNASKGWAIPDDEDPWTEGYQIKGFNDYVSWRPKEQFEEANRLCDAMTFGYAVEAMKIGHRVSRVGWDNRGMFIYLVNGTLINRSRLRGEAARALKDMPGQDVKLCSHIDMKAADGSVVVGWLASQADVLADDWVIV